MDLNVLGPLEAVEDGHPLPLGGLKQRTVLALLVANRGRPVSTDALIDGVYGEDAPSGARRSVQTYVSNLRSQLGDVIRPAGSGYTLDLAAVTIDADVFEDTIENGDETDPGELADQLRTALSIWRGLPYADIDGFGAIPSEVTRLNELRMVGVERRVDADLAAGRHAEVVGELESLTTEYPFREPFRAQQMLALYRSGRQAEALRAFEKARVYLVEEMGLDPSPELRELERRILEQDPALGYLPAPTIRRVAVLVADVADPTALAGTDPQERTSVVDAHADALGAAIEEHNGHAFAQRGTALYAWFGSVADAVSAAEDTQWTLADVGDERLRTRIAIDLGDVERVGGEGVQGPPVGRAAALLACARGGHVLLAPAAHAELTSPGGEWQIQGLGTVRLDGVQHDLPVHLLSGGWPMAEAALRDNALAPAPPDRTRSLPGYEWREKAGEGVFGTVHRAYQPSLGREVAIKRIHPEVADHPDFIRRFEVEARLVARLQHPHVVPLYDFWRDGDGAFLVTRWMDGGSLAARLRRGALGVADASRLLSQVGPALDAAHRKGVVHRDIRPENVLADEDGNWYLGDFGGAYVDPPVDGVEKDLIDLGNLLVACVSAADEGASAVAESAAIGRYANVESLLADWDAATGHSVAPEAIELTDARNPYKGLGAFGELDASDFYGRDALVGQLVASVDERGLTAVVGPSGIGKSSVVRAGLIPAVRNGAIPGSAKWLVTDMVPSSYPFEQLASALERVGTRTPADLETRLRADSRGLLRAGQRYLPKDGTLLLVVDQFEELFTLVADEAERAAFLDLLAETAADSHSSVKIVLTIRADFFDRPLRYAAFGQLLRSGTVNASAPTDEELRQIITGPATAVGVGFETGLVDRICIDVGDQPGTLPLLQFALTRLFDRRSSDVISSGDYNRVGGVLAALGRRAEEVVTGFSDSERDIVRQFFLRLVNVTESGRSTRRRTRLSELNRLGYSPAELAAVVDPLVAARLLTLDRDAITRGPTVEVAHEALLSEWPRLAEWVAAQREDLLLHSRLASAAGDWEGTERSDRYLLQGGRLEQHEAWTASTEISLTTAERAFLDLSRKAEDGRRSARRRARQRVLAGFGVAAVLALTLAFVALVAKSSADEQRDLAESEAARAQQNEEDAAAALQQAAENELIAERERELAVEQSAVAEGRRLLANAAAVMDEDPQLAMLLALAGLGDADIQAADLTMLRETVEANRVVSTHVWEDRTVAATRGDLSPDGQHLVIGADPGSYVTMVDSASGEEVWRFSIDAEPGLTHTNARFVSSGTEVLVNVGSNVEAIVDVPQQVGVYVLDAASGSVVRRFTISPCGAILSASDDSQLSALFLAVSATKVAEFGCGPTDAGFVHRDVVVMDLLDGATTTVVADFADFWGDVPVALSADGTTVAIHLPFEDVMVYDTTTGLSTAEIRHGASSVVALSPDGAMVVFGGLGANFGRVLYVHETATGARLSTIAAHPGGTSAAEFSKDSATIVTAGNDGAIRVWTPGDGELVAEVLAGDSAKGPIAVSEDGRWFGIFGAGAETYLASVDGVDLASADLCSGPSAFYQSFGLRVREERALSYVACGFDDTRGRVVELATGEIIAESQETAGFGVDLSPDGRSIASQKYWSIGSGPSTQYWFGTVTVQDIDSGEIAEMKGLCDFNTEDDDPEGCAAAPGLPLAIANTELKFSPDGTFLAAVEDRVRAGVVWDATTGDPIHVFEGSNFAFSADSGSFLMVSGDRLVLLDTAGFGVLGERTLDVADSDLANLEFTPDGKYIVGSAFASAGSGDVLVLHAETLEEVLRIHSPHAGGVRDLAVSTDGMMLATAGTDGYVGLWDLSNGEPLMSIPVAPDSRVQVVAFFDGDQGLLAGTVTGPIYRYRLNSQEVLDAARSRVQRGFTDAECSTYFRDGPCPTFEEISNPG